MGSLLDPATLITLLASAGAFVTIVAVGLPLLQRDTLQDRMQAVTRRREELSRQQRERLDQQQAQKTSSARYQRRRSEGFMRAVLERLQLQRMLADPGLRNHLARAGLRSQGAAVTYIFFRVCTPLVTTAVAALFIYSLIQPEWSMIMQLIALALAAGAGYYLPTILLSNMIQKRQTALNKYFPDALDLLVICVEAGLSIEAAFKRVAHEIAESAPEIAEEFGLTQAELAFLGERHQAYDNLAQRTGIHATKSLATNLIQAERYGTPVSVSLRVLSQENRDARMSVAEKKAAALPAQLTVPMIVFFLPGLFVIILGPTIIRIMNM